MNSRERLRIAVTADPELPVPPRHYGGAERIVHMVVEGLHARGHDVTLFAHPESHVSCRLVPYSGRSSHSSTDTVRNAAVIAARVRGSRFDLLHSYGRLAYLAPLIGTRLPKFMSYGRAVTPSSIRWARRLFGTSIEFTACSRHMTTDVADLAPWHVIYNAVPAATYTAVETVPDDAPLVFLGRIEHIKGTHLAIETARRAGRKLVIAGNIEPAHQRYFDEQVRPAIDGERVRFIGPVNDSEKNALLGSAWAFLMPILWDEPFGMVMAEALACGTPVIGLNRASVPEIVSHDTTGFVVDDIDEMVAAVERIPSIDRLACRRSFDARFSDHVIVDHYEQTYYERLDRTATGRVSAATS